jgi:hypothetical protein
LNVERVVKDQVREIV